MRLFNRLGYFARDAVDEWRHSPGVNILATATLAAVLFVGGLFLLLIDNASRRIEGFRSDLRVEVYLNEGVGEVQRDRLRDAIAGTAGVTRVEYVSQDEAAERFRTWFPDLADVPSELTVNPFPASLEVYLGAGDRAAELARSIRERWSGAQGVDEVRFDIDWIDRVDALLSLARTASVVVGLATFAAVVFVIASVLRLAVYARRDEIEIMMLVGATPGFARGPFLFSGFVQGFVASTFALVVVESVRRALLAYGTREGVTVAAILAERSLDPIAMAKLVGIGVVVSVAGAWLAVRRDLGLRLLQ